MKVDFSTTVPFTPEWRQNRELPKEEQVSCDLTVLDMNALMSLVDAFTAMGIEGTVDTDNLDTAKIKPILEQFGSLLPAHIENFIGLYDKSGRAVTVEDVVKYPRFLNLALELLMQLSTISSPSDDDAGNSNEPSASEQVPPVDGSQVN